MINHSIAQAGVEKIVEKIEKLITDNGGKIVKKLIGDMIKVETLIKKSDTARYAFIVMEFPADKLIAFNYDLKVTEGLDRHIILKTENSNCEPATFPVVSEKDYRRRPLEFWKTSIVMENPAILKFFLTPRGKIINRKLVFNFIGKDDHPLMRQLSVAVKQARFMGWLKL